PRSAGRRCGTPAAGTAGARAAAWHRRAHLRGVVRPPEGRSGMQPSLTAAHEHGPGAPASGAPARPPRRTVWIALLIAGVAVRLFLWWFTVGTNDVATWASHGQNVGARGLAETYRTERLYNHPPLIGLFAAWAVEASGGLTLPFARLIKLP